MTWSHVTSLSSALRHDLLPTLSRQTLTLAACLNFSTEIFASREGSPLPPKRVSCLLHPLHFISFKRRRNGRTAQKKKEVKLQHKTRERRKAAAVEKRKREAAPKGAEEEGMQHHPKGGEATTLLHRIFTLLLGFVLYWTGI